MNSRERILTALDNKQPDRLPIFELYINESSIVRLAKILMPEQKAEEEAGDEKKED